MTVVSSRTYLYDTQPYRVKLVWSFIWRPLLILIMRNFTVTKTQPWIFSTGKYDLFIYNFLSGAELGLQQILTPSDITSSRIPTDCYYALPWLLHISLLPLDCIVEHYYGFWKRKATKVAFITSHCRTYSRWNRQGQSYCCRERTHIYWTSKQFQYEFFVHFRVEFLIRPYSYQHGRLPVLLC